MQIEVGQIYHMRIGIVEFYGQVVKVDLFTHYFKILLLKKASKITDDVVGFKPGQVFDFTTNFFKEHGCLVDGANAETFRIL